jgi:hypothetical protein
VKHKVALPVGSLTRQRLPQICPLSGKTEGLVWRKVSFDWVPAPVAAIAPLGLLISAIAAVTMDKAAAGELPFRPSAWWRWKLAQVIHLLAWFPAIVLGLGSLVALFIGNLGEIIFGAVMLLIAIGLVAGARLFLRHSGIAADRIVQGVIVLRVPNERAARVLAGEVAGASLELPASSAQALEEAAQKTTLAPDRTRCAYHPDTLAAWCCGRCGSFFCPRCATHPSKGSNPVCAKCFGVG